MRRYVRMIWRFAESDSSAGAVVTFRTEHVLLPENSVAVEYQREERLPELIGCEWLGEEK